MCGLVVPTDETKGLAHAAGHVPLRGGKDAVPPCFGGRVALDVKPPELNQLCHVSAGGKYPAETWQSRLGSGWITSSGKMPLPPRMKAE